MAWQWKTAQYTGVLVSGTCSVSIPVFKTLENQQQTWPQLRLLKIQVYGHNMSHRVSLAPFSFQCFILRYMGTHPCTASALLMLIRLSLAKFIQVSYVSKAATHHVYFAMKHVIQAKRLSPQCWVRSCHMPLLHSYSMPCWLDSPTLLRLKMHRPKAQTAFQSAFSSRFGEAVENV